MPLPLDLNVGDPMLMRAVNVVHIAKDTGKVAATASYRAPKGRVFVALLIGEIDPSDPAAVWDSEPMLNALGWYFHPTPP